VGVNKLSYKVFGMNEFTRGNMGDRKQSLLASA